MKKILLSLFAVLAALGANAQHHDRDNILDRLLWDDQMLNIMLDMRIDGQYTTGNRNDDAWGFSGQTFKIWIVGEIIPGIRYRVRHRLNRPTDPSSREGFSAATDQAWLAFDFGRRKQWTITVGKQSVQFGTFEYDYNPADIYLPTMAFNDLDAYKTGVNVAYRFLGQTINLQVVNSDAPQFASHEWRNKALALNILWEGSLWNDMVRTRWAWGGFQHSKDKLYNWLTAGIQLNVDDFTAELDYYFGDRNIDYTAEVDVSSPVLSFVRDQSAALNLKYDLGRWRPSLKGTWNNRHDKDFGSDAYGNWGLQAVMEFYPFTHRLVSDLRFHAMYSYNDTGFHGNFSSLRGRDAHTALIGIRWLFKAK